MARSIVIAAHEAPARFSRAQLAVEREAGRRGQQRRASRAPLDRHGSPRRGRRAPGVQGQARRNRPASESIADWAPQAPSSSSAASRASAPRSTSVRRIAAHRMRVDLLVSAAA
jgi:hypothetical protein